MRRLLIAILLAFALLRIPYTPHADEVSVSVYAHNNPNIITPQATAPIEVYTPQQTRNSSLHRRVPVEISNNAPQNFYGAVRVTLTFPEGRAPYVGSVSDPSTYYIEVRDSEGSLIVFQIDTDYTLLYDANHAERVVLWVLISVPRLSSVDIYVYFDIEAISRTPPSFDTLWSVTPTTLGYDITGYNITYSLITKSLNISPTVYVLNPGIRKVAGGAYFVSEGNYPIYELMRSGLLRTIFYFYNYTYYQQTGFYIPIVPHELLSVINPNYTSNGRPTHGEVSDQYFEGAHGGIIARRFLEPPSSVIAYADYGRAFTGALYAAQSTSNFDGSYPTDPTTSNVGRDADYRKAVGRNASFIRFYNGSMYFSYLYLTNHYTSTSTISGTLYSYYSPMHAIDGIYEHFSSYVEYLFYAPRDGSYTLSFASDDQMRVRVDGQLAINARSLHGITRYSTSFTRKAGTRHLIQIEFAEGPGYYDLHMKFKVTDPNDPNIIYVGDQYTRLDSFAVPYSRAVAPYLAGGIEGISTGPVFAKLSFKDAPVVPIRGVYPNVLDSNFDRYDISYGNASIEYYFLPNGDVYVNASFTPKPDLAGEIAIMPTRRFDNNFVEPAISGASAGNIAILSGDNFLTSNAEGTSYIVTDYGNAISILYEIGVSISLATNIGKVYQLEVPLASLTDSNSSYPNDATYVNDPYKQKAAGIGISGVINGTITRDFTLHVYIPGISSNIDLYTLSMRHGNEGKQGFVETVNGLHVIVQDIDGNVVDDALVEIYYLGYAGVNETSLYLGYNVTINGEAALHSAIFTGNYSVKIAYNTSIGRVNNTYTVFLNYTDIVNTKYVTLRSDIVRLNISLAYINGTLIEGPIFNVHPYINVSYGGEVIATFSDYNGITDYIPANYSYTINATVDVYGYPVNASITRSPISSGSNVIVEMPLMPVSVFVANYDATNDVISPYINPYVIVTFPNGVSYTMYGYNGRVRFPVFPINTNVTLSCTIQHLVRGNITLTKRFIATETNTSTSLLFKFRKVTLYVTDYDSKPIPSATIIAGQRTFYTNATGYVTLYVPDSSIVGTVSIIAKYTDYSYLLPVETRNTLYLTVTSTSVVSLVLPMRDFTVNVTDVAGNLIDKLYRITLYGSIGVIYDGYASGSITFRHMNAEPSLALKVNVTFVTYGYEVFVSKVAPYSPYLLDMRIQLPVAHLTVYVNYLYAPSGELEGISGVAVTVSASNFTASEVTDYEGKATFEFLPLSILVGDYNVSTSVEVRGINTFESTLVTLDTPKTAYLRIELDDISVNISKASGEPTIAKLKVYLDGHLAGERIVNATGTLDRLPLKYIGNMTIEAIYETYYGYLVDERYSYTGIDLESIRSTLNASITIHVGKLNVYIETLLKSKIVIRIDGISLQAYGNNVTFDDVPYGTREVDYTVYTAIAPAEFSAYLTLNSSYKSYTLYPSLGKIEIHAMKPSGEEINAKVTLYYDRFSLSVSIAGNATLEEMPLGNYSFVAIHETPYGLPVSVNGSFVFVGDGVLNITFPLADISIALSYNGSAEILGTITLELGAMSVSGYGNNVTFEEIPYGTRDVSVEYTNIATLVYSTEITVNASGSYVLSLPLVDLRLELKNYENSFVAGNVLLTITGENIINGSAALDITGSAELLAVPIGHYKFDISYTTPYGIPVEASLEKDISTSGTVTLTVPSGAFKLNVIGENNKPVPVANVRIEFLGYTSIYTGTLANGSFSVSDFPYGVKLTVTINGTFHGFYVRTTLANITLTPENYTINVTMPLIDVSFTITDQDTGGPAAGATVRLYFVTGDQRILVASGVTDDNGYISFERIPSEEFMSSIYGSGQYVVEIEYKGAHVEMPLSQVASVKQVTVNPPVPRTYIIIAVLAIALAAASIAAYYYRRHVLGPYHRLKKAIMKGEEVDLDRLPTRENEVLELYKSIVGEE